MLRTLLAFALACLILPAMADDDRAQTQQQLEKTRQDIADLKKTLGQIQQERSGVQKDLSATETEMGKLEKQVEALQNELKKSDSELQRLDSEKKKLQSARTEQQQLIAIQARAAYQGGRQEYLKLLLNQQNPEKFARTLTYYDYMSKARLQQLRSFNETLRQLADVEKQISMEQAQQLVQQSQLTEQRAELDKVRQQRREALAKLNDQYKAGDSRLQARQQDQAELNQVLKAIEERIAKEAEEARQRALLAQQEAERKRREAAAQAAAAQRPPPKDDDDDAPARPRRSPGQMVSSAGENFGGAFSAARGKLPWPVDGRLLARFGDTRGSDERTKWDGVMIAAPAGATVRAVHGGRVVFADWLRGAGLLVILDHGDGYLTLYGHNQTLLKHAGDVVKAGEALSTVGTSGGQDTPALYFAIRQQGRATDPAQWCRG